MVLSLLLVVLSLPIIDGGDESVVESVGPLAAAESPDAVIGAGAAAIADACNLALSRSKEFFNLAWSALSSFVLLLLSHSGGSNGLESFIDPV